MTTVPGQAGLPLVGDKSLDFYKDVIQFVKKRIEQHNCRVFLTRFLNKPTVFIASHAGVKQLLNEHHDKLELGYQPFMHQVYANNIIFLNGIEAFEVRDILKAMLTGHDTVKHFRDIVNRQTEKHIKKIQVGSPIAIYELFKRVATEICLSMFLDINFEASEELANQIVSLTTTHWHGIVSVPVSIKIGRSKSTFSKAVEAKEHLLEIINRKLAENSGFCPQKLKETGFPDNASAANHLLLFTSALVPKALGSLITSFVLATAGNYQQQKCLGSDPQFLAFTLLEVQRLWPPIFGGRRIATQDMVVDGYHIPSGHGVVYLTHPAQRDPEAFQDPEDFRPERWINRDCKEQDLFVLGSGPRDCVGKHLVSQILTTVCQEFSKHFTWEMERKEDQDLPYKWLPVTRPKNGVKVIFQHRDKGHTANEKLIVM